MKSGQVLLIGLSLIIAATIFGIFFYNTRAADDTITVVGAATKRFESDIVKWRVTLARDASPADMASGYNLIQKDLQFFRQLLRDKGFTESDITIQPVNTMPNYSREGQISGYTIQQELFIITSNLAVVEGLAINPMALTESGIVLRNSRLEYFYSKLSDIKMELLAEATKDASRRAKEIADNSGASLGNVSNLRAGVFQITEPFSSEVSDYGMYNTQTKQKDITVTVRASYRIK
jgi:uncharacterized protein